MKKIALNLLIIGMLAQACYARINFLDEHSPGIDLRFSRNVWYNSTALYYETDDDFNSLNAVYSGFTGINPFLELGFDWSIKQINPNKGDTRTGLTDIKVAAKYNLFKKTEIHEEEPIFIGEALFSIPSGDSTKNLGAGGYGLGGGIIFGIFYDPVVYSSMLNYTVFSRGNDRKEGSVVGYGAAAEYAYNEEVMVIAEIKGKNSSSDEVGGLKLKNSRNELYFGIGLDYEINHRKSFSTNILLGLTKKSSDLMLYASLNF